MDLIPFLEGGKIVTGLSFPGSDLVPGGLNDRTAFGLLVGWDQYASFLVQPPAASPGVAPTSAVFGASLFLASTRRPRQDRESYQPRCGEYTGGTEINKKTPSAAL